MLLIILISNYKTYIKLFVLIVVISLFVTNEIDAQYMHWSKLNISFIDDIAITQTGDIYAVSSWNRKLYKSIDSGGHWDVIVSNIYAYRIQLVGKDTLIIGTTDGKIFLSINNGASFNQILSVGGYIYSINYKLDSLNSLILVGTANGYVYKSTDLGNTWTSDNLTSGYISSIRIIDNRIYIATSTGLYYSDNNGQIWQSTTIVQVNEEVLDIAKDLYGNLFASVEFDIYKSSNGGMNWNLVFDELVFEIEISSENEIFAGEYRSIDQGNTWQRIIPTSVFRVSIFDSLTYMVDYTGSLYKENQNPYNGSNYYPLTVGNQWQYIGESYHNDGISGVRNYNMKTYTVLSDTSVDGKTFYKINAGNGTYYRYGEDNVLYSLQGSTEQLYMDFNLYWGDTFQFGNTTASVFEGGVNIFGRGRYLKGFVYHSTIYSSTRKSYIDSIGFWNEDYYDNGPMGSSTSWESTLINSLIFFDETINTYKTEYEPQINITPITITNSLNNNLSFSVNHNYSKFSSTGTSRNFIKDVWIKYYYSKNGSVTNEDSIEVQVSANSINCSVILELDSIKCINGYKFNYAVYAKDKSIFPQISRSPEIGFYELIYDTSFVNIDDDNKKGLSEFNLLQNYPNPFNPSTTISWQSPVGSWQTIKIYNTLGQEVETIVNEYLEAGLHSKLYIVNSTLPSGVYFYQLKAGSFVQTKKMILMK